MAARKEKHMELKQKVIQNLLAMDPEDADAWLDKCSDDEIDRLLRAIFNRYQERINRYQERISSRTTDTDEEEDQNESPASLSFLHAMEGKINKFFSTLEFDAIQTLQADEKDKKASILAKLAIRYFFSSLPIEAPWKTGVLTDQEKQDLKAIYQRITAFEKEHPMQDLTRFFLEFIDSETLVPKEKKEIIKAIVPLRVPKHHVMVNNALQNSLSSNDNPINAGPYDLKVLPKTDRRKEVTAYIIATLDQGNGLPTNLTEFERNVSDALCSIWEQARKDGVTPAFDLDSLYRAMPGGGDRATAKQKQDELAAIDKFDQLKLTIDATDEMRYRGKISDTEEYTLKGRYCTFLEHKLNETRGRRRSDEAGTAKSKTVWEIRSEPLNLTYAKMTGQIITVPSKVLQVKKLDKNGNPTNQPLQMTTGRRNMISYLLRSVAVIQRDHEKAMDRLRHYNNRRLKDGTLPERTRESFCEQSNVILFKTLFHRTGNDTDDRRTQSVNRNFCFDVLDFWKATEFINGYTKQIKGRTITGIEICW